MPPDADDDDAVEFAVRMGGLDGAVAHILIDLAIEAGQSEWRYGSEAAATYAPRP